MKGEPAPLHAKDGNQENFVMAWPKEPLLRAGIIVGGEAEGKLEPKAIFPFYGGISEYVAY